MAALVNDDDDADGEEKACEAQKKAHDQMLEDWSRTQQDTRFAPRTLGASGQSHDFFEG